MLFVALVAALAAGGWFVFAFSDFIVGTIMLLLLAAVLGTAGALIGAVLGSARIAVTLAVLAIAYVVLPHFIFSLSLWGLEGDFVCVAHSTRPQSRINHSGNWEYDYDGRLSRIVQERNRRMRNWRMSGAGEWFVGDFGPSVRMVYFWTPWWSPDQVGVPDPY